MILRHVASSMHEGLFGRPAQQDRRTRQRGRLESRAARSTLERYRKRFDEGRSLAPKKGSAKRPKPNEKKPCACSKGSRGRTDTVVMDALCPHKGREGEETDRRSKDASRLTCPTLLDGPRPIEEAFRKTGGFLRGVGLAREERRRGGYGQEGTRGGHGAKDATETSLPTVWLRHHVGVMAARCPGRPLQKPGGAAEPGGPRCWRGAFAEPTRGTPPPPEGTMALPVVTVCEASCNLSYHSYQPIGRWERSSSRPRRTHPSVDPFVGPARDHWLSRKSQAPRDHTTTTTAGHRERRRNDDLIALVDKRHDFFIREQRKEKEL
jgi:hypothetical protein